MKSPDAKEIVEAFFNHPNPIIYSHRPSVPELCQVVIPNEDGTFNNKAPHMGLGSLLLEARDRRDLRSLWHSWDDERPRGLWRKAHRQALVDTLDKPLTFFFDGVIREDPDPEGIDLLISRNVPDELRDPKFVKLDVRKVPFIPWLTGSVWNFLIPQASMIVGSLVIPAKPTQMRLAELGLEYAAA